MALRVCLYVQVKEIAVCQNIPAQSIAANNLINTYLHNCAHQGGIHINHGIHEYWVLLSFGSTVLFASYKLSLADRTKLLFLIAEVIYLFALKGGTKCK